MFICKKINETIIIDEYKIFLLLFIILQSHLSSIMNQKIILFLFLFISCTAVKKIQEDLLNHFPVAVEKPATLPSKENFYIFILAGQSNMAGRGFVEPQDTVPS